MGTREEEYSSVNSRESIRLAVRGEPMISPRKFLRSLRQEASRLEVAALEAKIRAWIVLLFLFMWKG